MARCYICDAHLEKPNIGRDGKTEPCSVCESAIAEAVGDFRDDGDEGFEECQALVDFLEQHGERKTEGPA